MAARRSGAAEYGKAGEEVRSWKQRLAGSRGTRTGGGGGGRAKFPLSLPSSLPLAASCHSSCLVSPVRHCLRAAVWLTCPLPAAGPAARRVKQRQTGRSPRKLPPADRHYRAASPASSSQTEKLAGTQTGAQTKRPAGSRARSPAPPSPTGKPSRRRREKRSADGRRSPASNVAGAKSSATAPRPVATAHEPASRAAPMFPRTSPRRRHGPRPKLGPWPRSPVASRLPGRSSSPSRSSSPGSRGPMPLPPCRRRPSHHRRAPPAPP